MTDDTNDAVQETEPAGSMGVQSTAVTSAWKVLGEFEDTSGVGVLGQNNAISGTPIGVQGAVPNATSGFGLYTDEDAFVGTRLETTHVDTTGSDYRLSTGTTTTTDAANVVQGHASNEVTDGALGGTIAGGGLADGAVDEANRIRDHYGTISGGARNQAGSDDGDSNTADYATVGGGYNNTAKGDKSTVDGGRDNTASGSNSTVGGGSNNKASNGSATVAGGEQNEASGFGSAVCGGYSNLASGSDATVAGGYQNEAGGLFSFAAGHMAKSTYDGAFVWADSTNATFKAGQAGADGSSPTGSDTFHVRATGGIRLVTGLDSADDPNAGQYLSAGGSNWQTVSARSAKQNIDPVDPVDVLAGVEDIEVSTWEYESNPGVRRMGPMAGDFFETFEVGDDPETIGHVDADGVALAAIQGLSDRLAEAREELEAKTDRLEELEAENDSLRQRLSALEDRVATLGRATGDGSVTADD